MSYETWCMIYSAQYDFKAVQNVLGTHSQVTSKWKKTLDVHRIAVTRLSIFHFRYRMYLENLLMGPVFFPSLNRHHGCVLAL